MKTKKILNPDEATLAVRLALNSAIGNLCIPAGAVRSSFVDYVPSKNGDFITCDVVLNSSAFCLTIFDLQSFESAFDALIGFSHGNLLFFSHEDGSMSLTINVYIL